MRKLVDSSNASLSLYVQVLANVSPYCQVTDPRDRSYAFLGFQPDPRVFIHPSYSLGEKEVATDVARSIIEGSESLDHILGALFP